jgi:hypothetical protein
MRNDRAAYQPPDPRYSADVCRLSVLGGGEARWGGVIDFLAKI